MHIEPATVAAIRELYTAGLYLQAFEVVSELAPIRQWSGTTARLIGGRLAIQLGAPKLGRRLHLLAYRATPAYPEAIYYSARYRMERFGPFAAWEFQRRHPDWSDAPPELHADWLALHGFVAGRLRDFDRAERWLNRSDAVAPDRPWPCVERASVYEFAERTDDALAAARRSLEIQPWFRPGVQATAHLLIRSGRDREALDFLVEATSHIESGLVVAQLASLQNDLRHHTDAARSLDRYAELTPLAEPEVTQWLAARRADTAYFLGDWAEAAAFGRNAGDGFYQSMADRLEEPNTEGLTNRFDWTVVIEKENHPAGSSGRHIDLSRNRSGTASAADLLTQYWQFAFPNPLPDSTPPADGLPDAAERVRAENAGWVAKEFTLTAEAAFELISRGVVFLVTFVESGFSQARLVVGADRIRRTVFLVDTSDRRPLEVPVIALTERFRATGPRCLAVVPAAEAALLHGLDLPDADAFDDLYAVQSPLLRHDRAAAVAAVAQLVSRYPGHRVVKLASLALARYDAHPVKMLQAADELLADSPLESTWTLSKAGVLRELNRIPERLNLLATAVVRPDPEPLLMQSLAQMLLPMPHRQAEAERLLRRSIRNRPGAAAGYFLLATQWWEQRRFVDAAEVYRFACTLDDREDQFSEAYFRSARATEQVPEALRLFQQKAGRAAVPTPASTRALYQALFDRDEPHQAEAALEQAIRKLQTSPTQDSPGTDRTSALGELLLFRAECRAAAEKHDEAAVDLATSKPLVSPQSWFRAAARLARMKPDLGTAVDCHRELLKLDPLSVESHRALASLLGETAGRGAVRTHLAQAGRRHRHYYPLMKMTAEFLSGDSEADADGVLQTMLEDCPEDAWALRQRALVLAERNDIATARQAVIRAGRLEPDHPWYYAVYAQVMHRADETEAAVEICREGLRHNIDQELLIAEFVQMSRGRQEKESALDFIADELRRQPHTGEGLAAYVAQAHQAYAEVEEHRYLLEVLTEILDARPDLWQAWSVVIQQTAALSRLEEAESLAREATDRFPLLAKLWLDRARVSQGLGNSEGRLNSLRQAVAVAPGWSLAAREMADALEEAGDRDEAVTLLSRSAMRSPLDPFAHGFLAERLWDAGRSQEAVDQVIKAIRLEPGYDWAWHALMLWSERLEVPDQAIDLGRSLTRERAGDPRVWLRLARLLSHPRHTAEVLAALDRVIALDPKSVEAHDLRAERLAEVGRFDEAKAAAQPAALASDLPFVLQGRMAWVEAKRGNYAAAIPPMHALVAVDPSYVWGWHQLADWYNETGKPQGYLEAASELVRLQPQHPVAWMMRGEAKTQTGDRDGGKADLREAIRISPGYSHAAAVLFDAHLEDEEFREARQVLAVLSEHSAGPEAAVKQVQLCCRTGEEEGAIRAFTEVCEGPGLAPYPLHIALAELREAGWGDRGDEVLREAWQGGGPFHPWAPLIWVDTPAGVAADPGDRLRAVDTAIKAYPKFVPALDGKAEQLALNGRYDEALAACQPAELGNSIPPELRGRAAWIHAKRGDRAKAISVMKQLLVEFPDFIPGWRQLAAWFDAAGRHRECLDAAEQFLRREPLNPIAHIYRGEARRSIGDRHGALLDFQRAFELDPAIEAAGMNFITEQLAAGDTAGAARTLATLQEHSDGPAVRLRSVQISCKQSDFETALVHLRELVRERDADSGMIRDALEAFDVEGWRDRLTPDLAELARSPDVHPAVAGLWAERAVESGAEQVVTDELPTLLEANLAAGREAVLAYLTSTAASGKPVQSAVQRYSEVLRSENTAWARTGEALVAAGNAALAAAWLGDWRDRDGIKSWMLRPLLTALRTLDQDDKAVEVCRAAVRLGGPDSALVEFRAWLAVDLAIAGRPAEAAAEIARVDTVTIPDPARLVLALAEAVVMVAQAGPEGKAAAFTEAKDHLRTAAGSCSVHDQPAGIGRAYRAVVGRIVNEVGGVSARVWAMLQRVRPWIG